MVAHAEAVRVLLWFEQPRAALEALQLFENLD